MYSLQYFISWKAAKFVVPLAMPFSHLQVMKGPQRQAPARERYFT